MIPRILANRLGVSFKLQGVVRASVSISPCSSSSHGNLTRAQSRSLVTARPLCGPGADEKYKSEEEREKEQQNKARQRKMKIFGSAILGGTLLGSLWEYEKYRANSKKADPIGNEDGVKQYLLKDPPPKFEPARVIPATSSQNMKITLFQYQTCPFCCKARAFLDYFGLSYEVIEVNSVMRTQVKWTKYKKVPIVVVEVGDKVIQVNDSSVIVSALYSLLVDSGQTSLENIMDCYPTIKYLDDGVEKSEIQNRYFLMFNEAKVERSKEDIVDERKWRKWVDDELVHSLSPNVYRSPSEALAAFQWFDKVGGWENVFSTWERYLVIYFGAFVMWALSKRLKKRHNLKDDVRQSLYDQCNHWLKNLSKKGTKFHGGSSPNLADLAVFGVLTAIEGCEAWQDARENTKIGVWFDDMKAAVREREGKVLLQN